MRLSKIFMAALAASTIAGSAYAADLPSRKEAAVAPPLPAFTWTGFYLGLQAGGIWSSNGNAGNNWAYPWLVGATPAWGWGWGWNNGSNSGGFVGGGHVGYNLQLSPMFVAGVEGDLEGASVRGSALRASLRGRLGLAIDRLLVYGTGGLAFAGGGNGGNNWGYGWGWNNGYGGSGVGWTAGAGLEYAFSPAWSARIEYRYSQYGGNNNGGYYWGGGGGRRSENAIRVGVSYHFGAPAAPVVAKY